MGNNNTGDRIKVAVWGKVNGAKDCASIFQYKLSANAAVSDATLLAQIQAMMIALYNKVLSPVNNGCTFNHADVTNETQMRSVGTTLLSLAGQSTGDALPSGVAAGVTAYTGTFRRRGRKSLWGFNEGATQVQVWTTSALLALTNYAAAWLAGYSWDGGVKALLPIVWDAVHDQYSYFTSVAAQAVPAYQRRRKAD